MDCNEVLSYMDDYYDDSLSDDQRIEIDKHLNLCFECNSTYVEMNDYFQQLRAFSHHIETPSSLHKEIIIELTGEKPPEQAPQKKGFRLFKRG